MPAPLMLGEKKPGASILMQPNRIDKVIKEGNTCGKVTTILPLYSMGGTCRLLWEAPPQANCLLFPHPATGHPQHLRPGNPMPSPSGLGPPQHRGTLALLHTIALLIQLTQIMHGIGMPLLGRQIEPVEAISARPCYDTP